jgi:uncharacterized C2H2 Zn-finger protein
MNKGIVYLIQPGELVDTCRYKIGCSQNIKLKRLTTGYKSGTRYILIMECENPFEVEKNIKNIFNKKFKLIAGHEYFEGDEKIMKDCFIQIMNNHISSDNNISLKTNNNDTSNITINNNDTSNITINNNDTSKTIMNINNNTDNNDKFKCTKCNKKFNYNSDYIKHINKKFPCDTTIIYTCNKCEKTYNNKTDYTRHVSRKYPCKIIDEPSLKPSENNINLNNNNNLNNEYKCIDCNKTYTTKRSYKRHIKFFCKNSEKNVLYDIIQNMQSQIDDLKTNN